MTNAILLQERLGVPFHTEGLYSGRNNARC